MQFLKEKEANKRISKSQEAAAMREARTVKLLILGAGGSGKSTLRKQFMRLYGDGFKDPASRKELADVIVGNLIEGAKQTTTACFDDKICEGGLTSPPSLAAAKTINSIADPTVVKMNDEIFKALKTLWADPAVQKTISRAAMFQLQECVAPFWQECVTIGFPEWGGPKWIPSIDDCIRSRIRTSGIIEVQFELDNVIYRVFDAGGQRAERRKWLHAFQDVTALIFVASLTEYDEVLYEDAAKNRLLESLEVFDEIINGKYFLTTPVILFMNKLDLFLEKYVRKGIPLNVSGCFPDAPAYTPEFPKAIDWITQQFLKRRQKGSGDIKVHTTTAVDPAQINTVFTDIKAIVLMKSLAEAKLE